MDKTGPEEWRDGLWVRQKGFLGNEPLKSLGGQLSLQNVHLRLQLGHFTSELRDFPGMSHPALTHTHTHTPAYTSETTTQIELTNNLSTTVYKRFTKRKHDKLVSKALFISVALLSTS